MAGLHGKSGRTRYVVEITLEGGHDDVRRLSTRAIAAAGAIGSATDKVRFVRTVYVPEDGACLLIFEAATPRAAREAAAAAGIRVVKVSPALTIEDVEPNAGTTVPAAPAGEWTKRQK